MFFLTILAGLKIAAAAVGEVYTDVTELLDIQDNLDRFEVDAIYLEYSVGKYVFESKTHPTILEPVMARILKDNPQVDDIPVTVAEAAEDLDFYEPKYVEKGLSYKKRSAEFEAELDLLSS